MSVQHWGEFPKLITNSNNNFFMEEIKTEIERAMDPNSIPVMPDHELEMEHVILDPPCPLIQYAIKLHKHAAEMTDMIRVAELALESDLRPPDDAATPIPEMPDINFKHKRNSFNFLPVETSDFIEGKPVDYPELSNVTAKEFLSKSVVTMLAHIGFETTHNSVLLLLTDVLEMFMKKLCRKFKTECELEVTDGLGGFACFPDKALTELGLGGMIGLHDYYQNRVIKYIGTLRKRSAQLIEKYKRLLDNQDNPTNLEIKTETMNMTENGAEMHITGMDDGLSSLAVGYQLLNSLEANLCDDDSMGVGFPPSSTSMLSEDMACSSSPTQYTKKKKK